MSREFTCADRARLTEHQDDEVIFIDNPGRWVLLPVEFPTIFQFYKALENQYWTPGPLIWDRQTLIEQISGQDSKTAEICSLAVYCILIDLKLYKGILASEKIDPKVYMDVLDQLCGITDYVQSPEARAFIGFQNMLEDFHREAINGSLAALMEGEVDPTGTVSSEICAPHVRHTYSKAIWVTHHLNGLTKDDVHALPGDKLTPGNIQTAQWQAPKGSKPCLPEALVALVISRSVFNVCGVKVISKWTTKATTDREGGGSAEALNKFLSHFMKDMHVFADFYAHLYTNLKYKLSADALFEMLTEAVVLEYQYLCTVYHELIKAGKTENSYLGSLAKAAILRVVSACGESPGDFEAYYKAQESRVVQMVKEICWPLLDSMRGTELDNSSLPFVMFTDVPGDWLATQWPIVAYSTSEDTDFHVLSDHRGEPKMEQIPSNTTAASALEPSRISNRMEYDEDF